MYKRQDHAVVKGFGDNQIGAGPLQIHILVDVAGHVAGAYAQRRFAGAVRCFDHAGTAGSQNQRNAPMVHQSGGRIQRRSLDPLNAVLRRTGFDCRIPQDPRRLCRAFLCRRVESEDDGVTGLGADEGFKHGSGGGVGHRSNAGYYTPVSYTHLLTSDLCGIHFLIGTQIGGKRWHTSLMSMENDTDSMLFVKLFYVMKPQIIFES